MTWMPRNTFVLIVALVLLICGMASAQEQPKLQEEVIVRWWLVPVYAVDKSGAPILNLAPEDIDVYIKNIKVEQFSLHKKEFQVTEAKKQVTTTPVPKAPAQKKMVFLVFDALFSPYNLLARAKAVADTVIAQSDKSAQYVLLSIEPMAGLHYVCGPTQDLKLLAQNMKKYIVGKKQDYLLKSSTVDRTTIRDVYPGFEWSQTTGRAFRFTDSGNGILQDVIDRNDWRDSKQKASVYSSALMTLNLVLGNFADYSKVIYLYSCGIPTKAFEDRFEFPVDLSAGKWSIYFTPDTFAYSSLTTIGSYFNKSGALLFIVNPAGTRTSEISIEKDSGEASLRILANESGGRYYEGEEKQIAQEVNNMEGGYYEISFPDKPEYEGEDLGFEIRPKRLDVTVYTVKKVGREKSYLDMTELEKEVLVLNILHQGPYALTKQKVVFVEGQAMQDGGTLVCRVPLPSDLPQSEYTVFKVARNFKTGDIRIDKEPVVPEGPTLEVRMKWRGEGYRHDIVLAHAKTGTILVWK
jgi:hypothetical protein